MWLAYFLVLQPCHAGGDENYFSKALSKRHISKIIPVREEHRTVAADESLVAGIVEQDHNALVALYNATDGANWTNNTGWQEEGVDAKDWFGVYVNDSRVTAVLLAGNNLSGAIPSAIGNLSELQSLFLDNNDLSGSIPTEIGSLSALQNLHLASNQLSGSLPNEIGNLVAITSLLLNNNQFSGNLPIEIGNLTNLQTLWLQYNQMSGSIPGEIGNLSILSNLNLQSNSLTGAIPQEIETLVNLVSLNLSGNQLSGLIPEEIWTFSGLQYLYLSYNQFSGTIPPEIANLDLLQALDISANQFSGTIPAELANLTNLNRLLLHTNKFTGSLPSQLGNLESLGELWVGSNPLTGPLPQSLTNLDNLATGYNSFRFNSTYLCEPQNQEWLDWKTGRNIIENNLECTPTDLYVFRVEEEDAIIDQANSTISLNLPGIGISATAVEFVVAAGASVSIGGVPQISGTTTNDFTQPLIYTITSEDGQQSVDWVVTITNQSIVAGVFEQDYNALVAFYNATDGANWTNKTGWLEEGVDAKDWFGIYVTESRVTSLSLSNNNLTGAIPEEISNLNALGYLNLSGNQLTGPIPEEIWSLGELQILDLFYNQLSGVIPPEIKNLRILRTLNLSSNQLSGAVPKEIGGLTSLYALYLSSNQLSGIIPSEIGNLSDLEYLNLSFNQFSGGLPSEIGNLRALETLQISYCQLSGPIPPEIGNLSALQSLMLMGNQLSGVIPAEIGNMSDLHTMLIENNHLEGPIPAEIWDLNNLQVLSLSNNQLTGAIPVEIGNLTSITELQLGNNSFSGSLPMELGDLQNLRILNVYSNPLTGLLPQSLTNLVELGGIFGSINYSGTYLCEPQDQEWLDWKVGRNITGNNLVCSPTDLYVFRVEGIDANIDLDNLTISLNLPGVDISATTVEFVAAAGASVSIDGVPQVSGATVNDFIQPLTYTITAEDGQQSVDWTVTITSQSIVAGVFEQDYNALVAFYNATNGPNWTNNTGWLQEGVDVRDWWGITVNENRVTYIYAANNNLTGFIPEEIGNLTGIQTLDFSNNHLTGTIPVELWNLTGIINLYINGNQLSGVIPTGISSLSKLQSLTLSGNQLTGEISVEIGDLSSLISLSLAFNKLSGTIPTEIGNLTSLQLLTISGNQLTGPIPSDIGNLIDLQNLWLTGNQLSGAIPTEIGELTNLTELLLDGNKFTGNIPAQFGNLPNLQTLNLSNNALYGSIPLSLTNLDNLGVAEYNSFSFTGTSLCEPQDQEWLDWKAGRNITGNGMTCSPVDLYSFSIDGLEATIYATDFTITLNLPGADLSALAAAFQVADGASVTVNEATQISGTTSNDFSESLTYTITSQSGEESVDWTVTVTNQAIVAGIFQQDYDALVALYNATNGPNWTNNTGWFEDGVDAKYWYGISAGDNRVRSISLYGNNLSGEVPAAVGDLTGLSQLMLNNNQLTGSLPLEIGRLTSLRVLLLQRNQLSGAIPAEIGNLSRLFSLLLNNNQFSGPIPTEIGALIHLQSLWLHYNRISGSIPKEIGNLNELQDLNFEVNELSGDIPVEIGNLGALQILNLSFNFLSGSIPSEIGNLSSLTQLLLYVNQLTGGLPVELSTLPNLNTISISNNPLIGTIPLSFVNLVQLANFNYSSTDLCDPQDQAWLDWKASRNITGSGVTCNSTELYFFRLAGVDANISKTNSTITLNLPGVDIGSLIAEFEVFPGASVSIGGIPQTSSVTINDFNQPLTYIITSEDGQQSVDWLVTISNQSIVAGIFEQDYNALVALYNSTDGPNWTNNSGWLEEGVDVKDWFGVTAGLERVREIALPDNGLSGDIPALIGSLTAMHTLDLQNNSLTGNIPTEISGLDKLQILYLSRNQLSGDIPTEIGELNNLVHLQLSSNQLSGSIPVEIGNLASLIGLWLYSNQLSGEIPKEIGDLSDLLILNLSFNQLSGAIPVEIGQLSSLTALWVNSNQLAGEIPKEIGSLSDLRSLYLSSNQLSGSIPREIGNISDLQELSLYSNQLSGNIPKEIGNLSSLQSLDFEGNQLSGTIPPEIGNLTNLTTLWLNDNSLFGSFPSEFGNLSNLGYLNVGFNSISGPLPMSLTNLDNLAINSNSFSYEGTDLCEPQTLQWLDWKEGRNIYGNGILCNTEGLLTFSLQRQSELALNETLGTIDILVEEGTELSSLVANFTLGEGATAYVNNTVQVSGSTTNNFSLPVNYHVVAEDGVTTKDWVVSVSVLQSITFNPLPSKTLGEEAFTLTATASSGLAVAYTSSNQAVATISGNTVTITGIGETTITASQPGNINYEAATPVQQTLVINQATQTITFNPLPEKTYGDAPFELSATTSSGLDVTFSSSDAAVASVEGTTVTILKAGAVTITASQAGNDNYSSATATQTLTINKAAQAIAFATLPAKTFGDASFELSASTTSGLTVAYASNDATVAKVEGTTVALLKPGSATITASQSGNENYLAAASAEQSLVVNKAGQTITFEPLAAKTFGDPVFEFSATSSIGLPVVFSSSDPAVVSVEGNSASIVKAGAVTITASQAGNDNYNAASAEQTLTIAKASQTITFDELPTLRSDDDPIELVAEASSGLPVAFQSEDETIAAIDGATLTITGSGTTSITATQGGDENYLAAAEITRALVVEEVTGLKNGLAGLLEVFPNPVQELLFIKHNADLKGEFALTSISGEVISNGYLDKAGSTAIRTSNLKDGIYLLTISNDGTKITYRIIKGN
ncbi:MAG: T9SS type A sorting domain-containing protein [Imperialibacter sp.]|uniref:leucine-rich repeat domain-containing protein n=1 Tax=Imperialibacter sp. TaxID=2038411 RepID=UPI003A893E6F